MTIDRIAVKEGSERRLTDSVEAALKLANGLVVVENAKKTTIYSTKYSCPDCDVSIEELEPRLFSFNNPYGACPECGGLGFRNEIDLKKIIVDEIWASETADLPRRRGGISAVATSCARK